MKSTANHHQGFTLIEIMVVVTIIGIMTGVIAINVVNQDPQ
ncbi:MAG: pilus assembly FimT family protein, partial [Ketobacter sp.]